MATPLKLADKSKPAGTITSESWLASLAKLAERLSTPPQHTQNNQA